MSESFQFGESDAESEGFTIILGILQFMFIPNDILPDEKSREVWWRTTLKEIQLLAALVGGELKQPEISKYLDILEQKGVIEIKYTFSNRLPKKILHIRCHYAELARQGADPQTEAEKCNDQWNKPTPALPTLL